MKLLKLFYIFILLVIICISCIGYKTKVIKFLLKKPNLIEYSFALPKDSLYSIILSKFRLNNILILNYTHLDIVLDTISTLFADTNNKKDLCLMPVGFLGKSKVYFKNNGDSLDYTAWFYIHLEEIGKQKTKVKILTFDSEVITGQSLIPLPPHFGHPYKKSSVEPSTIEEYQILLKIGDIVGEQKMPTLILPVRNGRKLIMN